MKKSITLALIAGATAVGLLHGDIQDPPGAKWGVTRKLSRAISNIVYGATEIPHNWSRVNKAEGPSQALTYGTIYGAEKTVMRIGYGLYELVTFPAPTYKKSYKPAFAKKQRVHPTRGYSEFPPNIGVTEESYFRIQTY